MNSPVFRTAVDLDNYLASLPPEDRALSPRVAAFKDQVDAASKEGIAEEERKLGNKARWVPRQGSPEWVRLGMYDAMLKWSEDAVITCIHQPKFAKPEPVFAAAWKPGVVVCARCTHLLAVTGVADTICDGCGHQCTGLPDDGIAPVTAFTGSLGYQMGVCTSCYADMQQAEKEATEN